MNSTEVLDVTFLSKVMQRRMCSMESYGMPEIVMTGSFRNEMLAIDMSTELDAYYLEQEYRQKRIDLGLMDYDTLKYENEIGMFQSAKSEMIKEIEERKKTESIHNKEYGLMGKVEIGDIMTACTIHPKSLYTVCGTLNNSIEIVSCASNPF